MHTDIFRPSLLLLGALAAGCATVPPPTPVAVEATAPAPEYIPVTRYGRYTLVELAPTAAQQDLLLQVVDVSIPDTLHASVRDALRHVLQRSGYQLCSGAETAALNSLPLPAAHYHLGPLQLRDALLTIAGPGRTLHVDHAARRVCFASAVDVPATTPPSGDAGTQGTAAGGRP
ncbi:PilL N-terminal domain-containing protein [Ectopseudomonas hydrolytica]|uniref:PFGI-1 class ICE element type IV pilus protein PilL2 n=1 Tax=Ectopseudomonas hydrolytica TaxID=2493633 RepID=UPI003EDFACC0